MKPGTLIIVQARTGSTRLPEKTVIPFAEGKSIFQIIAGNLVTQFGKENVVLATTTNPSDDRLVKVAEEAGMRIFRGDEQDVLGRFIGAAKHFHGETIVRVCADNPFLLPGHIETLIHEFEKSPCDYLSFCLDDGTPVIRSHWGLFTEVTTLKALEKVNEETTDSFFHEHVTNYLYMHPEKFSIRLLQLPEEFAGRKNYRFTLDTQQDFNLLQELYTNLYRSYYTTAFTPAQLFDHLDKHPEVRVKMQEQIESNAK